MGRRRRLHRLIVSHSHSCGPDPPGPPTPFGPTIPPGPIIIGLGVIPKPFANPTFTFDGPAPPRIILLMPVMRVSLSPPSPPLPEFSGGSTSIPEPSIAETDFECRR